MTDIAVEHREQCDAMGSALSAYLRKYGSELRKAVLDDRNASPDAAMDIFKSSVELHQATNGCQAGSVDAFRRELSEIILQSNP